MADEIDEIDPDEEEVEEIEEEVEDSDEEEEDAVPKKKIKPKAKTPVKSSKIVRIIRKGGSYSSEQLKEAIQKARLEERKKLQAKLGKEGTLTKLQKQVKALLEENKQAKLDRAKLEIIQQYEEQVVPELISGETEEEIAESATKAHEAWKRAVTSAGVEIEEPTDEEEADENEDSGEIEEEVSDESDIDEESEGIEDEDEDEEEVSVNGNTVLKKQHRQKFKQAAGKPVVIKKASQPANLKSQARAIPPVLPSSDVGGGGRRSEPLNVLKTVRGMSLKQYRDNRAKVMEAVKQKFPNQKG
jgi:hypothetical protein